MILSIATVLSIQWVQRLETLKVAHVVRLHHGPQQTVAQQGGRRALLPALRVATEADLAAAQQRGAVRARVSLLAEAAKIGLQLLQPKEMRGMRRPAGWVGPRVGRRLDAPSPQEEGLVEHVMVGEAARRAHVCRVAAMTPKHEEGAPEALPFAGGVGEQEGVPREGARRVGGVCTVRGAAVRLAEGADGTARRVANDREPDVARSRLYLAPPAMASPTEEVQQRRRSRLGHLIQPCAQAGDIVDAVELVLAEGERIRLLDLRWHTTSSRGGQRTGGGRRIGGAGSGSAGRRDAPARPALA